MLTALLLTQLLLLSNSSELKENVRIYLYDISSFFAFNSQLFPESTDESWQNVIKEYNVVGPNVVHYNLPKEQQSAIEHYLNIHSFPTYKLIDRESNVLDLDVNAHDLEGLAKLLEKIK